MTRWRLNISSKVMSETGDVYAIVGSSGWWFCADPDAATRWEHYRHAAEAAARCPDIGPKVIMIEPVYG